MSLGVKKRLHSSGVVREPLTKISKHEQYDLHSKESDETTLSQMVMTDLLSACRSTLKPHDAQGEAILRKIQKIYSKASKSYVESEGFVRRAQQINNEVRLSPNKMWVLTNEFFQELKAYKQKAQDVANPQPSALKDDSVSQTGSDVASKQEESDSNQSESKVRRVSSSQLRRMEELLESHHKEIQRYEQMELSFDDMEKDDSTYLICERLKRRAGKIFDRICELKGRSTSKGGAREKKFKYSGSRYHELNVLVQRFVNKQDFEERMPDYSDIKKIVKLCNEKHKYCLNKNRVTELSKEVFVEVGGMISSTRKKDFGQDFGPATASRAFTNDVEDPATFSSSLKEKLKANQIIADKNLKEEFQRWADQQSNELDEQSKEKDDDSKEDVEEDGDESCEDLDDAEQKLLELPPLETKDDDNDKASEHSSTAKGSDGGSSSSSDSESDSDNDDKVSDLSNLDESSNSGTDETNEEQNGESSLATETDVPLPSISKSDSFIKHQLTEADVIPSPQRKPEVIELESDSD